MISERNGRNSRGRVRVAVVGLGYWGPNLVRNLLDVEEAELACVCDSDPAAIERLWRRYPGLAARRSYAAVLDDPTIDAVAVATPVATHYGLARAALEAGKHVFVEKPLAGSAREAADLAARAAGLGLVLMPGHTFLYSPPVNLIRDLIQGGELGDIYFVSMSRVNLGIHQPDVSVVWDLGPHDFSILRYWLDESPMRVSAVSRGCIIPDKADVAFIHLEYPSGTLSHVELSWVAPSKLRRTTVVGSRQMVVYDDTSLEPVRVFDSGVARPEDPQSFGEFQLSYRTGPIVSPRVDPVEPLLAEMRDFCASVRDGTTPRASADIGLDVVEVIEAVERSLHEGTPQAPAGRARELARAS